MVKSQKRNTTKKPVSKAIKKNRREARKISASTHYETCSEQLSPFGGALALSKFLDLIKFEEVFKQAYHTPTRKPKLSNYKMVVGIVMLIFIGFNRLAHFAHNRTYAMLCGFFRVFSLPVVSTFWRYVNSLGINQANSLLKIMTRGLRCATNK